MDNCNNLVGGTIVKLKENCLVVSKDKELYSVTIIPYLSRYVINAGGYLEVKKL